MSVTEGNIRPTAILDYLSERLQTVRRRLGGDSAKPIDYLRACHGLIVSEVKGVYSVDELRPASVTLTKAKGSCSQRFACLEAAARANGIATRVRGLWIAGRFWAPRFPLVRVFIPTRILLALPQFFIDGRWLDVEELYGPSAKLAERNPSAFANDAESMFDAISHTAVDFQGRTAVCSGTRCDLSRFVLGDAGTFDTRDELFAKFRLFQNTIRGKAFEWIYGGRKSA